MNYQPLEFEKPVFELEQKLDELGRRLAERNIGAT